MTKLYNAASAAGRNDMDMLIVGTTTNRAPPFCANCTCSGRDPETNKPICHGCDDCARPKVWETLSVAQVRQHPATLVATVLLLNECCPC